MNDLLECKAKWKEDSPMEPVERCVFTDINIDIDKDKEEFFNITDMGHPEIQALINGQFMEVRKVNNGQRISRSRRWFQEGKTLPVSWGPFNEAQEHLIMETLMKQFCKSTKMYSFIEQAG